MADILSDTPCLLGEGAFWHPEREQFFWFDILGRSLLTRYQEQEKRWHFEECFSAAGWIDNNRLLLASASGLWVFNLKTGENRKLRDLEADNPQTRSNDGRADPYGGFWIGTMGYNAEPGAGAIYRFYKGEIHKLFDNMTIPNAICFSPDRQHAFFTDTVRGQVMRQKLDCQGWPDGIPRLFLDFGGEDFGPDGAVVDQNGNFWNAQWGAARVACYSGDGKLQECFSLPTPQASCPAFGGHDLSILFVTTAAEGLTDDANAGQTYSIQTRFKGQKEHRVEL